MNVLIWFDGTAKFKTSRENVNKLKNCHELGAHDNQSTQNKSIFKEKYEQMKTLVLFPNFNYELFRMHTITLTCQLSRLKIKLRKLILIS